MSQKLNGGCAERVSQVADLGFKNCNLGPKAAIFGPKQPQKLFKVAKQRESVGTLHVRLDFPLSTSPLRPSNSSICPGNGPKRPPEAPNFVQMAGDSHKPRTGHIFGYMAKNAIPTAPSPPTTPLFVVSTPQNCPNGRLDPVPRPGRLRQAASSSPNRWVPKWVNRVQ